MIWVAYGTILVMVGLVVWCVGPEDWRLRGMERRQREGMETRRDWHHLLRWIGYKRRWHRDELIDAAMPKRQR